MVDSAQISLGWAFLAGPGSLEALDETTFADPEALYSLGAVIAVLGDRLGEEREADLLEDVARVQAKLVANSALAIRNAALQLARLVHGGSKERVQRSLDRTKLFFRDSAGIEVDKLIAEVRKARRINSLRRERQWQTNPLEHFIRERLIDWFYRHGSSEIPRGWWERVAGRFAKKLAGVLRADKLTHSLITGIALKLNGELQQLRPHYRSATSIPFTLDMLDVISAGEILDIRRRVGANVTERLANYSDPLKKAKKAETNREAVIHALSAAGYQSRVRTLIRDSRVALASTPEEAVRRALILARGGTLGIRRPTLPVEKPGL